MTSSRKKWVGLLAILVVGLVGAAYQFLATLNPIEGMRSYTTSSTKSKRMGVFDRQLQVSRRSLRHDSLYSMGIEEAYLENYWVCDQGCTKASDIDSVGSKTLIVRLQRGSAATGLTDTYSIRQQHGEIESYFTLGQDGVLLAYISADLAWRYPPFPLKFYVYGGSPRVEEILLDSITFY